VAGELLCKSMAGVSAIRLKGSEPDDVGYAQLPTRKNTGDKAVITFIDTLSGKADIQLVAAAKNGNREAFDILVERHEQRIFFVARRITRTREDAEDVVQQSFQKAFTHLRQFEARSAFSTWLTRVAINEALMLQRKAHGLREVLIDDLNGNEETITALEVPDSGQTPEVNYSQRERQRILFSAMNELPHRTRRAIQLRELDEHSTKETARILGISVGAVKGRVFHGRRKLRERLEHVVGPARASGRKTSRRIGNTRRHLSQDRVACDSSSVCCLQRHYFSLSVKEKSWER
jgi:RNA polymerase sigma-70 factor (ECF subfamily)